MTKSFYWRIATVMEYRLTIRVPLNGEIATFRIKNHNGGQMLKEGLVEQSEIDGLVQRFFKIAEKKTQYPEFGKTDALRFLNYQLLARFSNSIMAKIKWTEMKADGQVNGEKTERREIEKRLVPKAFNNFYEQNILPNAYHV